MDLDLPRKTNRGGVRRKIEIEKIDKRASLQVTFSKRRHGLFKKAAELCVLTGAKVAMIAFSPGGKAFTFGHPSVESVTKQCLPASPSLSDQSIDGLGLEELERMKERLLKLKREVMSATIRKIDWLIEK